MATPLGPLVSLMFSAMFMIALARFSPALTAFVVVLSATAAWVMLARKGHFLLRWIMDVLDRLTDRASLERAYEARARKLVTIDAEALA